MIMAEWKEAKCITHGGTFHADDVFCLGLFDFLLDNPKVSRLDAESEKEAFPLNGQIWFDIGEGKLDHHQKGGNGFHTIINKNKIPIPNASFGLVWKEYGIDFCKKYYDYYKNEVYFSDICEFAYCMVEKYIARGIDASDNGIFPMRPILSNDNKFYLRPITFSYYISLFNPEDEEEETDNGLKNAVLFSKKLLASFLNKTAYVFLNDFYHYSRGRLNWKYSYMFTKIIDEIIIRKLDLKNDESLISKGASMTDTLFPKNKLCCLWNAQKKEYCEKHFSLNPSIALNSLEGFINGICADESRVQVSAKGRYDEVYFATIGTLFGEKDFYNGDYENDFRRVISFLIDKTISELENRLLSHDIVKNEILIQKGRILILDRNIYWRSEVLLMPEAQKFWFVISPTKKGSYKVVPVRSKKSRSGFRKGFPDSWLGLRRNELRNFKGISGVEFIHDSGILALCDTLDDAVRLCKRAYGNNENK